MLDAILAAHRARWSITYTGANETPASRGRPPCRSASCSTRSTTTADGRSASTSLVRHPLQAFDARNVIPAAWCPVPFSFDRAALAGARAAAGPRRSRAAVPRRAAAAAARRRRRRARPTWSRFFRHPVRAFLRAPRRRAADEGTRSPTGCPVELDGLEQWAVGDRLLRDLLAGSHPDQALATSGGAACCRPGGSAGGSASEVRDQAMPGRRDRASRHPAAGQPRAVDVDVDLGGGRRLTRHRHRALRRPARRRHLLPARPQAAGSRPGCRCWPCARPTRPALVRGCVDRASRPRRRSTGGRAAASARVDEAPEPARATWSAIYDAGLREPLPLPLKTGHRLGIGAPGRATTRVRRTAECKLAREPVPRRERRRRPRRGCGARDAPLDVLLGAPRPGEEYDGETTRLGALAMRLWRAAARAGER